MAVAAGVIISGISGQSATQFSETPAAPLRITGSASYPQFSYSMVSHSPDNGAWFGPPGGTDAEHGSTCSGPPTTHVITNYEDMIYVCSGHVMTVLDPGNSQSSIALTPNKIFDWTGGPATFTFHMSTGFMSTRDWTDFLIVPFDQSSGGWYSIDDNAVSKTGINVSGPHLELRYVQDHKYIPQVGIGPGIDWPIVVGTNMAAARQPFKFTLSRTHARMEMLPGPTNLCAANPGQCLFFDTDIPDTLTTLGMTKGVLQVGQHAYDPTKGEQVNPIKGAQPPRLGAGKAASWHWDEFVLSCNPAPCQTITFIRGNKRQTPATASGATWTDTITFASPAPAGSYLRFNAVGHVTRLSFDNGATWQDARCTYNPATNCQASGQGDGMVAFFHPVPTGTTSVRISLTGGAVAQTVGRDFEIWSLAGQAPPGNTPTPVSTVPVPSTPPGSTPTPPISTAVPTVAPTATVVPPGPTPTPAPVVCEVRARRNGVEGWVTDVPTYCNGIHP